MSLDDYQKTDLVNLYWERALQTKADIDFAIEKERWNMAANRIYYSMFHAVCALFVQDDIPVKSHRGCNALLGSQYVLTGKLSPANGHFFSQMESLRDKADYDIAFKATREDIEKYKPMVDDFFAHIEMLIKN